MFNRLFGKSSAYSQLKQKIESSRPVYQRTPWDGDMILEKIDNGKNVQYSSCVYPTVVVQWVSKKTGEDGRPLSVRTPQESTRKYLKGGFTVAGKFYVSLAQLTAKRDEYGIWCEDCYGREVFCVRERFPCFDSSDFIHENRFYRWFFLRENGKLWRVFSADESPLIYVTKDVRMLESGCWDQMKWKNYNSQEC